jgi:hypothetical protein
MGSGYSGRKIMLKNIKLSTLIILALGALIALLIGIGGWGMYSEKNR